MPEDVIDPRIERVFEAWDARDADLAAAQFAPDGRFHEVPRGEDFSREAFRSYLSEGVFSAFPDYSVEEKRVLTSHDWATVIEWTFSGTHEGDVGGTNATGTTVTHPIVSVVTVAEDGITSWRDFFDGQSLDQKLDRG